MVRAGSSRAWPAHSSPPCSTSPCPAATSGAGGSRPATKGLAIETIGHLRFGAAADADRACLLHGWSYPEDGFTWTIGGESGFRLPVRQHAGGGMLLLELELNPFAPPGGTAGQRLSVLAGGVVIAEERIVGEGTVAYAVPSSAWPENGALPITLRMPDACRPAALGISGDGRALGFMVRSAALRRAEPLPPVPGRRLPPLALPATRAAGALGEAFRHGAGISPADLLGGFESLGHNCEFGMAQRHFGAEPLGLLRFAGITLPDLLRGLDTGFAGLGAPDQLEIVLTDGPRREFIARDRRHNVSLHTLRYADESEASLVHADSVRHLGFLRAMFSERLASGDKVFAFQRPGQTLASQARPLLERLRSRGPNALLFVTPGDDHPPGTVEELGYGFFRGWTDRAAPHDDVGNCNLAAWLGVCANARRLWAAQTAVMPAHRE